MYDDAAIAKIDERSKSNTHRLDEQEKRIDNIEELTTSVKVLATREERVESDVKEIKDRCQEARRTPRQTLGGACGKPSQTALSQKRSTSSSRARTTHKEGA